MKVLISAAALFWAGALAAQEPARVLHNQPVAMRDGVKLAADVYLPADGKGHWPAVLMRTPYDKRVRAKAFAEDYASHGYVVVVEDVRGRYASGGHWRFVGDDQNDGFDTAAWITRQPWSDGQIGTVGTSYEGGTQHALALSGAPGLKAMVPRFAVSDVGEYGIRHAGAFELRFFNWVAATGAPGDPPRAEAAARAADTPAHAPILADLDNHVGEYVRALPLKPGATPLKYAPDYESWLIAAMDHGDDDAFWTESGVDVVDHVADYRDVPSYEVTGWYDSWSHNVADMNYPALAKSKKSSQKLIIGPWTHSAQGNPFAGQAQFTPDARIDIVAFERRWFDHWMKGIDNGVEREPPVRLYVMGGGDGHKTADGRLFVGGHWRDEQEWPLKRAKPTPWYLHAGGVLSPEAPRASKPIRFKADPADPVPTIGGNLSSQGSLAAAGVVDQKPLAGRTDIVRFESPPLAADMEITGPLEVTLWASSDGPDTDFTAKLVDEWPANADFPQGYAMNVVDGIERGRYRASFKHARMLTPGRPYPFTITLYPTSLLVKAGHRLRLDIASSNFPRFDVNPNTGEPLNRNRSTRVATNTIFLDPAHPSHVTLPVVPAETDP